MWHAVFPASCHSFERTDLWHHGKLCDIATVAGVEIRFIIPIFISGIMIMIQIVIVTRQGIIIIVCDIQNSGDDAGQVYLREWMLCILGFLTFQFQRLYNLCSLTKKGTIEMTRNWVETTMDARLWPINLSILSARRILWQNRTATCTRTSMTNSRLENKLQK